MVNKVFKLETAVNGLIAFSDGELAYITKRFDRVDGIKIKQEDFASLAQRSEQSYGKNYKDDYSYEEIAQLIKKYLPAMVNYFKLILFNYLIMLI